MSFSFLKRPVQRLTHVRGSAESDSEKWLTLMRVRQCGYLSAGLN